VLHGDRVTLRGRADVDEPVLTAELFEDLDTFSRSSTSPWRPLALGESSPYANREVSAGIARFTVVDRSSQELLGAATLWGIDTHNRSAHVGVSLRAAVRGRGYGTDTVAVLCHYAFVVLGLHRLGLETLADNEAMLAVARRCGFVPEGITRESSWLTGRFTDDVLLGLLATEWAARSHP
jgi:RimJ/RimL family protein N-acetyltransferase